MHTYFFLYHFAKILELIGTNYLHFNDNPSAKHTCITNTANQDANTSILNS